MLMLSPAVVTHSCVSLWRWGFYTCSYVKVELGSRGRFRVLRSRGNLDRFPRALCTWHSCVSLQWLCFLWSCCLVLKACSDLVDVPVNVQGQVPAVPGDLRGASHQFIDKLMTIGWRV